MNLRDNEDGTCNCKPLGDGCFFTHPYDDSRPCDCKCHNTPDTEWEERFDKQFSRPLTQASKNGGYEAREYIKIFIRNLLSSHTTYWKERVRKASYEIVKEFQDNLITIAIENEHLRGCVTSNQIIQAFKDFEANTHPALTNEDNLK